MADESLTIVIQAKDLASRSLKSIERQLGGMQKEVKRTSSAVQSNSKKMNKSFSSVAAGAKAFLAGAAVGAVVSLGKEVIKAASDMEETINKIDVVFEENAETVKDWAKDSIRSMGLAQQTALDTAALFGDMATGMGLTEDQALEMSTSLTQLSADLASFKNIRQDVAETALKSVFTGETESLKNLGVVMTQANLAQFAMEQGIQKNIKAMTQAELVNLRYQFVLEATSKAHGDFERTGGGAANQMRMFQESMKELKRIAGEELLPTFTSVIQSLNTFISSMFGSTGAIEEFKKSQLGQTLAGIGQELSSIVGESGAMFKELLIELAPLFKALGFAAIVALEGITNGLRIVTSTIKTTVNLVKTLATAISALFSGDFSGAIAAFKSFGREVVSDVTDIGQGFARSGQRLGALAAGDETTPTVAPRPAVQSLDQSLNMSTAFTINSNQPPNIIAQEVQKLMARDMQKQRLASA